MTALQVIVGVLLFMPLLLLLPTVVVFYSFVTLLHAAAILLRLSLQAAAELVRSNPAAAVVLWLCRPGLYPGESPPAFLLSWVGSKGGKVF